MNIPQEKMTVRFKKNTRLKINQVRRILIMKRHKQKFNYNRRLHKKEMWYKKEILIVNYQTNQILQKYQKNDNFFQ